MNNGTYYLSSGIICSKIWGKLEMSSVPMLNQLHVLGLKDSHATVSSQQLQNEITSIRPF